MNTSKSHGSRSVILALVGNSIIMIAKFVGFFFSGSSALFSEGIHSLADTMNQSLLIIGIRKSTKKADENYSYGYSQERFFWALISACGVFFLGAGVTLYHGVMSFWHQTHMDISPYIYYILIISFIIEAFTFVAAIKELRANQPDLKLSELWADGDPITVAVILEDGVALLGVLVALFSILLSSILKSSYWDGVGSIIIGLMLAVVAIILINKNRLFLLKKTIPLEVKEEIIELMLLDPIVEKVLDFKSTVMDINNYHIKCEVEINGSALMKYLYQNGHDLKDDYELVHDDYEEFKKLMVEQMDRIPRIIGKRIDAIEGLILNEFPEIRHIDIEVN